MIDRHAAEPLPACDWLRGALQNPLKLQHFALADWDLLTRQARRSGLLGRLARILDESGLGDIVPNELRLHFDAEHIRVAKLERDVRWEVRCLQKALGEVGVPLILLKGAAYLLAGLPPARGRLFTDVDILVPKTEIIAVEKALQRHGWALPEMSAYDDRFYRVWMHQIPPMTHVERLTTVDVHHTIVPHTVRLKLDATKIFAAARSIEGACSLKVLSPADMILHSATHLFNEGEFARGLRDLDDINLLLRHYGADRDFWPALLDRAAELDLRRPLYYALRNSRALLGTQVSPEFLESNRIAPPIFAVRLVMDTLFGHALRPFHESCRSPFTGIALWLLYVRSHYIRLPLHKLVPHLLRKAYVRRFKYD